MVPLFNDMNCNIIMLIVISIPIAVVCMGDALETNIWNYLQKDKNKPLPLWDEKDHDIIFGSKDEIVEFDASKFKEYEVYDKAYPDRFRVKYDENLNRIW